MRKFFPVAISLFMLLSCMTLGAFPADAPYGEELTIHYASLSEEEQELYDLIYRGVIEFREEIDFPHGYDVKTLDRVLTCLDDDAPELFWMENSWTYTCYEDEPETAVAVQMSYIMDEDEATLRWKGIMDFFDSLDLDWDDDLLDEMCIIRAILENTEYVEGKRVYDASAAIVDGIAVCEGYAKAAALLLRLRGIPSGVIGGTGHVDGKIESHAWNMVRIGDEWTLLDLTWSDGDASGCYDWINLSASQFADTHVPGSAPAFYAEAGNTYEIARLLDLYSRGTPHDHFLSRLERLVEEDIPITIYFGSRREYDDVLENHDSWMDEFNERMGDDGFYGRYCISSDDDRLRFSLDRKRDWL